LTTFADRGCHVVSVTDPYGRILSSRPEKEEIMETKLSRKGRRRRRRRKEAKRHGKLSKEEYKRSIQ
jgi:hypothetical protein